MKNWLILFLIFNALSFYNCKSTRTTPQETSSNRSSRSGSRAAHLEAFLPPEVLGVKRSNLGTERVEISDKDVITVSAEYRGTDRMLRITITDATSSAAGVAGLAPWVKGDVDNKGDHGYERTAEIEGYKGYESYTRDDQSGQVSVVVNNRFIVSVDGERVSEGEPGRALKTIDLKKLASLK